MKITYMNFMQSVIILENQEVDITQPYVKIKMNGINLMMHWLQKKQEIQ